MLVVGWLWLWLCCRARGRCKISHALNFQKKKKRAKKDLFPSFTRQYIFCIAKQKQCRSWPTRERLSWPQWNAACSRSCASMSRSLPYRHGHRPCVSACARGFVFTGQAPAPAPAQAQAQAQAQARALVTEPEVRETRRRRLAVRAAAGVRIETGSTGCTCSGIGSAISLTTSCLVRPNSMQELWRPDRL